MGKYRHPIRYTAFEQRVRRHRRSELVDAIAQLTAFQAANGIGPPKERLMLPWALAGAAKESLRAGNEYRDSGVAEQDLAEICGAFNAAFAPFKSVHSMMVQVAYEQFPYQVSDYEEMARPFAMYTMAIDRCETEMLSREFWIELLGCEISQAAAVALLLSTSTEAERGRFDLSWLELPNFAPIVAELPADIIRDTVRGWFSADMDWFRDEANLYRSDDEQLRRYDYNPLIGRPLVALGADRFLAPAHPLILRRVSPSSLYFMALPTLDKDRQKAFTRDVGKVFHEYVGLQLAHIPDAEVIPEIRYGSQGELSVDWFVVWPDLVLLVEAKSTPLTQAAKVGLPKLEEDVNRTLGRGFEQVTVPRSGGDSGWRSGVEIPVT